MNMKSRLKELLVTTFALYAVTTVSCFADSISFSNSSPFTTTVGTPIDITITAVADPTNLLGVASFVWTLDQSSIAAPFAPLNSIPFLGDTTCNLSTDFSCQLFLTFNSAVAGTFTFSPTFQFDYDTNFFGTLLHTTIGPVTDEITVNVSSGTTPLPAALPLFATGLGGLGLLGWRRKRKAQAVA